MNTQPEVPDDIQEAMRLLFPTFETDEEARALADRVYHAAKAGLSIRVYVSGGQL